MKNKPLYFILPDSEGRRVFVNGSDRSLPKYDQAVATEVGFDSPAPFNQWFFQRFGIAVHRRYAIDLTYGSAVVFVLEPAGDPSQGRAIGQWMDHTDAARLHADEPIVRDALVGLPNDYVRSATMPWVGLDGFQPHLRWMKSKLRELGYSAGAVTQVKNAYLSTVFQCATDRGDVYLKVPGRPFIREFAQTQSLLKWGLIDRPEWLSSDETLGTILMKDLGGRDLPNPVGEDQLMDVCRTLADFQYRSIEFAAKGADVFYDWRISQLLPRLDFMAETAKVLLADSPHALSAVELEGVAQAAPMWRKFLSDNLRQSSLPATIDHGDLYPLNTRVIDGKIIFYDWAWASVAHPFIAAVHLLSRTRLQGAEIKSGLSSVRIREDYLARWTQFAPMETLAREFAAIERARHLYFALVDSVWLSAVRESVGLGPTSATCPDAWTLDYRQMFYASVLRRVADAP